MKYRLKHTDCVVAHQQWQVQNPEHPNLHKSLNVAAMAMARVRSMEMYEQGMLLTRPGEFAIVTDKHKELFPGIDLSAAEPVAEERTTRNPLRKRWEAGAYDRDGYWEGNQTIVMTADRRFAVIRTWFRRTAERRYRDHVRAARIFDDGRKPYLERLP